MLRILTFLATLVFATAAAAGTAWVDAPKDGYLNLRTGPGTGYHIIEHMPHRSQVEVLHSPGKWVKLRSASGRVGWAHGGWLSDHRPGRDHDGQHGAPQGTWYVDAPNYAGLNLRTGPGIDYKVARLMRNGDRVELLGKTGKWWLLRHESGNVGYAHSGYLSQSKPRKPHQYGQQGGWYGHSGNDMARALLRCRGREGIALQRCVARHLGLRPHSGHPYR